METIAKTGFLVSLISYGAFWFLDILRPGFVARSFSVHLFLFGAIVFGIWWGMTMHEYANRPWLQFVMVIILGIALAVLTWTFGEGLHALRVLLAVLSACVPFIVWNLLRS